MRKRMYIDTKGCVNAEIADWYKDSEQCLRDIRARRMFISLTPEQSRLMDECGIKKTTERWFLSAPKRTRINYVMDF
jgi:hypothetical protein